jgi:hypothetical protein
MKTIAFAAAVAVATIAVSAAATPAFAQQNGVTHAKVRYDVKTDRYCVRATLPSTIVPMAQCRSKAQWAQNGLTINHEKPAVQLARR